MGKRTFSRNIFFILLFILLFFIGRFYREIDSFFLTPYSIVGLLLSTIGVLVFYNQYLKAQVARKEMSCTNNRHEADIVEIENRQLIKEVVILKKRIKKYKSRLHKK